MNRFVNKTQNTYRTKQYCHIGRFGKQLGLELQFRWQHCTGVRAGFFIRSPVSWVGSGITLLTPDQHRQSLISPWRKKGEKKEKEKEKEKEREKS